MTLFLTIGIYNASNTDAVINLERDDCFIDLIENKEYRSQNKKLLLSKKELNAFLLLRK